MLGKFLCDRPEARHQLFNFPANQLLAQVFNRFTNQLVAQAKRKHDSGTEDFFVRPEQRGGKCVLGSRVHGVAAHSWFQREAYVACFQ